MPTEFTRETLLGLYRTMATIRAFEERVAREFKTGNRSGLRPHVHRRGRRRGRRVREPPRRRLYISTHRGHGHAIAKGCDLKAMMAEIYGRETGLCKGRGGSMHVADSPAG